MTTWQDRVLLARYEHRIEEWYQMTDDILMDSTPLAKILEDLIREARETKEQ